MKPRYDTILQPYPTFTQIQKTCTTRANFHKRAKITFNVFRHWQMSHGILSTQFSFHFEDWRPHMAKTRNDWIFANVPLNETHEDAIAEYIASYGGDVLKCLTELISDDYKLSVSWVDDSEAFCATLTGHEKHKYNPNTSLSAWSDDMSEVIFLLSYKHAVICDRRQWPIVTKSKRRWG